MNKLLSALCILTISFSASALTLPEKKQYNTWNTGINNDNNNSYSNFKAACGYQMLVTIDEKMVTPFMADSSDPTSYCDSARSAMAYMCADATSKTEITKKVKKISCHLGKAKETEFKLNGTELVFTVGVGASNLEDAAKKFLENHL